MNCYRRHLQTICSLILSVALTACAGPPSGASIDSPDRYDYTCIDGCVMPEWVASIPVDANGHHSFVGLSGYQSSEQSARDEALINARKEYAAYTGVEVSSLNEVVRASLRQSSDAVGNSIFGRSSSKQATDVTVSERSQDKQTANASVSRFKGQKYHLVRFSAERHGKPVGSVIQCYVLASVPINEIERVRQWKKEQEALSGAAKAEQQDRFRQTLQRFEQSLATGEAMTSFGHWRSAAELTTGEADTAVLKAALARWGQSITLDVGRFTTLCVVGSGKGCILPVWARSVGKPVPQLPLVLRSAQGAIIARAVTAADGRAEFLVPQDQQGSLRVEIDAETGYPPIAAHVNLLPAGDFAGHLRSTVMTLFGGPGSDPLPVSSVTLGPVSHQRGPAAGPFALAVKGELRQSLTSISGLTVRDPQPRNSAVISQAVTRGIALSGKKELSVGDSSIQAAIDGAEAALDIDYQLQGANVVLSLSLVRAYNDDVLRTAQVLIPATILPAGLSPRPSEADSFAAISSGGIRLDIASHLGSGQIYREGEVIRYFLNSDRDCHLLLIYQDAAGQLLQIFPNSHNRDSWVRSGTFTEFPRTSDPFEFVVSPPFGTERVLAFAASRPFPALSGTDQGGLLLLNDSLDKVLRRLREFGRTFEYGESAAIVVTAAK